MKLFGNEIVKIQSSKKMINSVQIQHLILGAYYQCVLKY